MPQVDPDGQLTQTEEKRSDDGADPNIFPRHVGVGKKLVNQGEENRRKADGDEDIDQRQSTTTAGKKPEIKRLAAETIAVTIKDTSSKKPMPRTNA